MSSPLLLSETAWWWWRSWCADRGAVWGGGPFFLSSFCPPPAQLSSPLGRERALAPRGGGGRSTLSRHLPAHLNTGKTWPNFEERKSERERSPKHKKSTIFRKITSTIREYWTQKNLKNRITVSFFHFFTSFRFDCKADCPIVSGSTCHILDESSFFYPASNNWFLIILKIRTNHVDQKIRKLENRVKSESEMSQLKFWIFELHYVAMFSS